MQFNAVQHMKPYLNTTEAAEYLNIKERKLYELVAHGAVPCSKATGNGFSRAPLWTAGSRPAWPIRRASPLPILRPSSAAAMTRCLSGWRAAPPVGSPS